MTQAEVRVMPKHTRPILLTAYAKVPVTKWDMGDDGEVHEITTVTLIVKDISDRDLRRLARTALEKVAIEVELAPTMEQTDFFDGEEGES